jgi:iron complex outermembrane receptor protein
MFRLVSAGRSRCGVRPRALRCSVSSLSLLALYSLLAPDSSAAQTTPNDGQKTLPQINVAAPRKRPPGRPSVGAPAAPGASTPAGTVTGPTGGGTAPPSPLNTGGVAESASRLGLTVRQTPATVEVVDQRTMRDQGYRTTPEVAQGAVGVLSVDAAGAPAGFSMRGFEFGHVNVLYDGIKIGPQSFVSRVMDTVNLDRVEFLKGPSSLMSGDGAIGGAVNYVSRQPTTGPIWNEAFISADSLGSIRSGFTSSGSTSLQGLDYYVGVGQAGSTASSTTSTRTSRTSRRGSTIAIPMFSRPSLRSNTGGTQATRTGARPWSRSPSPARMRRAASSRVAPKPGRSTSLTLGR